MRPDWNNPADSPNPTAFPGPGMEWPRADPEDQGLDPGPIRDMDALMQEAKANGVLIRQGDVVAEWNHGLAMDEPLDVKSITKSFTSLLLGLALDDGLVPGLDTPVKDVYPAFEAGPFTGQITFRHLATMTAGTKSRRRWGWYYLYRNWLPPGVAHVYNADQPAYVARALTYLYGRPLLDVLQERILDPIGASAAWPLEDTLPWSQVLTPDGREVPVHTGWGGMRLAVDDLARVGYLFLNGGRWAGRQLISSGYIDACWTESPFKPFSPTAWGAGYGLYWWRLVPGVWYMSGLGQQFCMVDVAQRMVMVKLNEFTGPYPNPMNDPNEVGLRRFYPLLYRATTGETFDVPEMWQIGWRACGRLPEDWDIAPI